MANELKMAKVNIILTLHEQGWSFRRIARELGIRRETVSRAWLPIRQPEKGDGQKKGTGQKQGT